MVKLGGSIGASMMALLACGPQVGASSAEGDATDDSGTTASDPPPGGELTGTSVPPNPSDPDESGDPDESDDDGPPFHPDWGSVGDSSSGDAPTSCDDPGSCDACEEWEAFVQGADGFDDRLQHLALTADDTIVAAGFRDGVDASTGDGVLMWIGSNGTVLDELVLFEADAELDRRVAGLAIAGDGRIAVLGVQGAAGALVSTVDVLEPDGTAITTIELVDPEQSLVGTALSFTDDGTLVVSGRREAGFAFDGFVRRYDDAYALAWERRGTELGTGIISIDAIAVTGGGMALAGAVPGSLWVGRLDDDGTLLWSGDDGGAPGDGHAAADIAWLAGGDLLLVGWQGDTGEYGVPWMMRFTGDGLPLWSETLPTDADGPNALDAVAVTDQGRIFVAGVTSTGSSGRARHVDELDCDGHSVWRWIHSNPESPDWGTGGGLAWSPALGVVVSGGDYLDDVDHRAFVARLGT